MAYTKTTWENGVTPVNADNMNKIEDGIANALAKPDAVLSSNELVGVGINGEQVRVQLGEGLTLEGSTSPYTLSASGGGGGGTQLYRHVVEIRRTYNNETYTHTEIIVNNSSSQITAYDLGELYGGSFDTPLVSSYFSLAQEKGAYLMIYCHISSTIGSAICFANTGTSLNSVGGATITDTVIPL